MTKEIFNRLADTTIDKDPNHSTFGGFKIWIKRQNPRDVISRNDEKEILMLLTYRTVNQSMNNVLYAKYLDQILF